jgi:hypothetical protein
MDLEDVDNVMEFAQDAYERGDDDALLGLFDVATQQLSPKVIVFVLSATNWEGGRMLASLMGWRLTPPSERLAARRLEFGRAAAAWLDEHEPARKHGLLRGFLPEDIVGPKPSESGT